MTTSVLHPTEMLRPRRKITGMSATLLPFAADGNVDWVGFDMIVQRTRAAGLIPAVNMDTGYANLIDETTRQRVLQRTQAIMNGAVFVAGAFVHDLPDSQFDFDAFARQIDQIQSHRGTPIIFQSLGLTGGTPDEILDAYHRLATCCDRFLVFELGQMFAPFGQIYDLETYGGLMAIPNCVGAKHSSLNRRLEWERLQLRDRQRPDFMVLTGNDLAIDMVMYGSDYLLGLSTFAPDLFAQRDAFWAAGDPEFYALNDLLQYLGFFAFRPPVPAYKHSAAQFLQLRGWIASAAPHPAAARRLDSDLPVLADIAARLGVLP